MNYIFTMKPYRHTKYLSNHMILLKANYLCHIDDYSFHTKSFWEVLNHSNICLWVPTYVNNCLSITCNTFDIMMKY